MGTRRLRNAVLRALRDVELRRTVQSADTDEMLARAEAELPREGGYRGPELTVVVAGGPQQQIIRPVELADPQLASDLTPDRNHEY